MKKSVLAVAVLASALSFGASSGFAEDKRECAYVKFTPPDTCTCKRPTKPDGGTWVNFDVKADSEEACKKKCESSCGKDKPEVKPVKPAPVIGIEL